MSKGQKGEALARRFLMDQGLKFLQANYRVRFGEIDLIMMDGETLVFVEVKYRSSERYGTSLEQVTFRKQQKIKLVAKAFLQRYSREIKYVRFDVVGIKPQGIKYGFNWVKGAFE